jgi:predicted ABC-type ATPase
MPTCWIIAGPNGAGKTTFALDYLPKTAGCTNFINADLIAAGTRAFDGKPDLFERD